MFPIKVNVPEADYHQKLISCQVACPVHTDARGYVRAIAEGKFDEAYLIARGPNPFASICGRICGAPCEIACRRGKIPKINDDGKRSPMDVKKGDRILIGKYSGSEIKIDNEELVIVREDEILAVLEK